MATKSLPQKSAKKTRAKKKLPPGVVVKNNRWYVRIRYRGDDGKRHASWRECNKNATHAKEVRKDLQAELDQHGHESLRHARTNFDELATYFSKTYLKPALFVDGRKISGRRSVAPAKSALQSLKSFFGFTPLRAVTHGMLERYKTFRLETPVVFIKTVKTKTGTEKIQTTRPRSLASVDRELEILRRMFTVALQEGWIHRSPFTRGDPLISSAQENRRQRILTNEEEHQMLELCVDARAHLRPLIICAIDTGMRWGEMTKIRVRDIDFTSGVITIEATHTKTLTPRTVGITDRLAVELEKLCKNKSANARVFDGGTIKTAWTTLRRKAGLKDIRWHDLRHTNATRIERSKAVSIGQLGRHLGHASLRSTERYVNQDVRSSREIVSALNDEAVRHANEIFDRINAEQKEKEDSESIN